MEQLFNVSVFVLFLVLWALFAYALVASQGSLDSVWEWSRPHRGVVVVIVTRLATGRASHGPHPV
jgi:hypothetical protein